MGPKIEHGQFALEETRDARTNRVRVKQCDALEPFAKPHNLAAECFMIWIEVGASPFSNGRFVRRLPRPIKRLAVEGCRRAQVGRCQAWIKRSSARIAINVDD